jgi:Flp pilus assembly protein protease CpaA
MNLISHIVAALEMALLLYAALTDIAARLIPNTICLMLASLSMFRLPFAAIQQVVTLLIGTALFFLLLLLLFWRGHIGGGDVKLLTAAAFGLPLSQVLQLVTITAVIGGSALVLSRLVLRSLPYPELPPAGSSIVRRVYAIERWRNLRRAPLPYGVAIACGGIWIVLSNGV